MIYGEMNAFYDSEASEVEANRLFLNNIFKKLFEPNRLYLASSPVSLADITNRDVTMDWEIVPGMVRPNIGPQDDGFETWDNDDLWCTDVKECFTLSTELDDQENLIIRRFVFHVDEADNLIKAIDSVGIEEVLIKNMDTHIGDMKFETTSSDMKSYKDDEYHKVIVSYAPLALKKIRMVLHSEWLDTVVLVGDHRISACKECEWESHILNEEGYMRHGCSRSFNEDSINLRDGDSIPSSCQWVLEHATLADRERERRSKKMAAIRERRKAEKDKS